MTTANRESKRILSVTVKRIQDTDSDTSYLGAYSDEAGDFAIVAVGKHEGEFLSDLEDACECGNLRDTHVEIENGYAPCTAEGCSCEDFDQVTIERGREYRYFNPVADNYRYDPDIRKYCLQDYERMRDLERGEWCYIGIKAEAVVQLTGDLTQRISSGGLWGVESDSGDDYFTEVEAEQLDELRDQLHAMGFTKRAIAAAFRTIERKED